ncbi:MAG: histidine kinase [Bacilli bacterium]
MIIVYLEKIRQEFYKEKMKLEEENKKNELKLKESIQFIIELEKTLDCNYDSFSPRKTNQESYNKIDSLKKEQVEYEKIIDEINMKIFDLNGHISEIDSVLKVTKEREKIFGEQKNIIHKDELFKHKILEIQEEERQRIARDLHDSIVQSLTNMIHKIEICSKLMDMDPVRCKLELQTMSKCIREIIEDMRRVIYDLRPMSLDDIGLDVTLERELFRLKSENKIDFKYEIEGDSKKIKPVVSLTLLRIVQEACSNSIKYANAKKINIILKYHTTCIVLLIYDDGIGFELEKIENLHRNNDSGFGIPMMKERVYLLSGNLKIDSEPGKGTTIMVKVPI